VIAGSPIEETGKLTESAAGRTIFKIRGSHNLGGSIDIISQTGNQIEISYKKWARAETESQARRFLDLIDLKLHPDGIDREIINILTPLDSPWQGSNYQVALEMTILLPEDMAIEGDLKFMQLNINGPFKSVNMKSAFSTITIQKINGPVEIISTYAPLKILDVTGSVKAENLYASISASNIEAPSGSAIFKNTGGAIFLHDIKGPVEAYSAYSPIEAENIDAPDGSMVFRTSYSPINVAGASGELICETSFSAIAVSRSRLTHGQSRIETSYSPISVEFLDFKNSQLFIYNNYNNINLILPSTSSSQIVASVDDGGRIHAAKLPVRPTYLSANRLEGSLGDGRGRIELKISGIGVIEIEGR
jgi:hypothetical protein